VLCLWSHQSEFMAHKSFTVSNLWIGPGRSYFLSLIVVNF